MFKLSWRDKMRCELSVLYARTISSCLVCESRFIKRRYRLDLSFWRKKAQINRSNVMMFTAHGRCVMSYKSKGINSILFAVTTFFNSKLREWFLSLTFSERIPSVFLLRIFYFLWILLCFVPMLRATIMTLLPGRSRRSGPDLYYIYCFCESLCQFRAIGWEPQCCYSTTMYGRHCLRRQHLY